MVSKVVWLLCDGSLKLWRSNEHPGRLSSCGSGSEDVGPDARGSGGPRDTPRSPHGVVALFIIIPRCYLPFLLCWHLYWWYIASSNTTNTLTQIKVVVLNWTNKGSNCVLCHLPTCSKNMEVSCNRILDFIYLVFKNIYFFIWLHWVLVAACGLFSSACRT